MRSAGRLKHLRIFNAGAPDTGLRVRPAGLYRLEGE